MTEICIYRGQAERRTDEGQTEEKADECREEETPENMDGTQREERHELLYIIHSPDKAVLSEAAAHMTNSQQLYDLQINLSYVPTVRAGIVSSRRLWTFNSTNRSSAGRR